MKMKNRISPIATRCTPGGREYLKLFASQPFFQLLVYELARTVGLLSQFDIERAMLKVRDTDSLRRRGRR